MNKLKKGDTVKTFFGDAKVLEIKGEICKVWNRAKGVQNLLITSLKNE